MKLLTIATSILFVGLFVTTLLLINIIPIWATLSLFGLYNFVAGILYSMMIDEPYRTPSPEQKPLIIPEEAIEERNRQLDIKAQGNNKNTPAKLLGGSNKHVHWGSVDIRYFDLHS